MGGRHCISLKPTPPPTGSAHVLSDHPREGSAAGAPERTPWNRVKKRKVKYNQGDKNSYGARALPRPAHAPPVPQPAAHQRAPVSPRRARAA